MKHLFKEIIFCTDFSENANMAFETARELAFQYGANLHIVHVLVTVSHTDIDFFAPKESQPASVETGFQAAQGSIEVLYFNELNADQNASVHLLAGYPATEIIRLAMEKRADLIVMGARGAAGLSHVFFGSTADRVVRKAPCSVLTVRPFEE